MKSAPTRARPRCLVRCNVRCCLLQPKMHSIILRRVCIDGAAPLPAGLGGGIALRHVRGAVSLTLFTGYRQAVAVLHRGMADKSGLRLPPRRLAIKSAARIGGAGMSVVALLLAVEIIAITAATVLRTKTLAPLIRFSAQPISVP